MVKRDSSKSSDVIIFDSIKRLHRDTADRIHRALSRARRVAPRWHRPVERARSWLTERRRYNLWQRVERHLAALWQLPGRLIAHRYCHTSKPTYINALRVLKENLFDRVVGLYVAFHQRVNRWRRPMVRSLYARPEVRHRMSRLLKKFFLSMLTKIIKLASRWGPVQAVTHRLSAFEAALRQLTVARYVMAEDGRREDIISGDARHCSVYAIVSGLPYDTWRKSGYYWWHRRWKMCEIHCDKYTGARKGLCVNFCTELLAEIEPKQLYRFGSKWQEYVDSVMATVFDIPA
jgi:hypothetical protein